MNTYAGLLVGQAANQLREFTVDAETLQEAIQVAEADNPGYLVVHFTQTHRDGVEI